jgi:hypothetical protein
VAVIIFGFHIIYSTGEFSPRIKDFLGLEMLEEN